MFYSYKKYIYYGSSCDCKRICDVWFGVTGCSLGAKMSLVLCLGSSGSNLTSNLTIRGT